MKSLTHLFQKGHKTWNKGMKMPLEFRKKTSEATRRAMTKERRLKISIFAKNRKFTEEHRKAISLGNKGKNKGELHYNWKGGFCRMAGDKIYTSSEYKEWRMKVFRRDGFLCRGCKIPNKRLHAHHILPKSKFPEQIFEIDNGITLCEECHKKTSTYGLNSSYQ